MYVEKLGLSPEQQVRVDEVFLDTTLQALTAQPHYAQRAELTCFGDIGVELESIHGRTHHRAHETLIAECEIDEQTLRLMGLLAVIDAMALPSTEVLKPKDIAHRALSEYDTRRRLFRPSPTEKV